MAENDNDFMGSSFSNYDTTENRMGGSGSGTGNEHVKMEFRIAGQPCSTGRAVAGTGVLILCEIIAVVFKADGEYGLASLLSALAGLAAFFFITLYKGREPEQPERTFEEFKQSYCDYNICKIETFIKKHEGTAIGEDVKRKLEKVDRSDPDQIVAICKDASLLD